MKRPLPVRHHLTDINLKNLADEQIPQALGLPISTRVVQKRPGGYNSDILLIETANDCPNLITKCYGLKKRPYNQSEALATANDLLRYRRLIQGLGVRIPKLYDLAVIGQIDANRFWLACTEEYVGEDQIGTLHARSDLEALISVNQMLAVTAPFLENDQPLKVGIDPLPGNYCQLPDQPNQTYVDFMPPRFFKNGRGYLVEWPEPTSEIGHLIGFWKHFTPIGILTIFLTQLCRCRPTGRAMFKQIILDFLAKHGQEQLIDRLVNLPGWSYINQPINRPTIEQLVAKNVYLVRNLACEIAYTEGLPTNQLDAFFKLCHFEDQFSAELVEQIVNAFFALLDQKSDQGG